MSRCFPIVSNHSTTKRDLIESEKVEQRELKDDGAKSDVLRIVNALQGTNIDGNENNTIPNVFREVKSGSGTKRFAVTFRVGDEDAADRVGRINKILYQMKHQHNDELIMIMCLEKLISLVNSNSQLVHVFAIHGGIAWVKVIMSEHLFNPQLQITAFSLIRLLCSDQHAKALLRVAPISTSVLVAMKSHFKDADLVKEACNTLEYIADNEDEPGRWCPAESESDSHYDTFYLDQSSVKPQSQTERDVAFFLRVMIRHKDVVSVQIAACDLLTTMMRDSETKDIITEMHGDDLISMALAKYYDKEMMVMSAMAALLSIVRDDHCHSMILNTPELRAKILNVSRFHKSNMSVQCAAIELLIQLHSAYDHDEEYDVDIEIFKRIAAIMSKFEDDVDIQTSACDLLIMLSCGVSNAFKLLESGVMNSVEVAKNKHSDIDELYTRLRRHTACVNDEHVLKTTPPLANRPAIRSA